MPLLTVSALIATLLDLVMYSVYSGQIEMLILQLCSVSICVKDIASTKPRVSTQRIQRCNFGKTDVYAVSAWIGFTRASEREKELKHSSIAVNVPNCVPQKQKLLQKSVISFLATSYVIHVISSTTSVSLRSCRKLQPQTTQT